jgi:hypothetical protein
MNAIITRYKKTVLSTMMLVGMSINGAEAAKCSPCQAAAAARLSARDAAAVALSIAATVAKSMELDLSDSQNARAPREELPLCNMCPPNPKNSCCLINQQLQGLINSQALCCAVINEKLDRQEKEAEKCCNRQEKEAEKCCKKIRHELDEIEDLVISVIDTSATCCSTTDVLLTSIIDTSAACCSVMELQISNLNASVADVFTLLMSVWDCTCDT